MTQWAENQKQICILFFSVTLHLEFTNYWIEQSVYTLWPLFGVHENVKIVLKLSLIDYFHPLFHYKELDASIATEELTLQHIEGLSEVVKINTSPAGAEKITEEMEELRSAWQKLHLALAEVQKELQSSLVSESEYSNRCKELRVDLLRLRTLVQNLSVELESRDGERTEEHMVAQWKTHTVSILVLYGATHKDV